MNCSICRKPIVLVPSAEERSRKYGTHPPSYYTALFTEHPQCVLRKRMEDDRELLRRVAAEGKLGR